MSGYFEALLGLGLSLFGFFSYFLLFARFPALRDQPALNMLMVEGGLFLALHGAWRSQESAQSPLHWKAAMVSAVLVSLGAGILLPLYAYVFAARMPAGEEAPAEGATLPTFSVETVGGETVSSDAPRDKKLVLVFFRGFW